MRKPGILLLLILTLTIAFATIGQDFRFDQALARERAAGLTLAREFARLEIALSDVRGAQTAYVAPGQDAAAWMTKASELFARVDAGITRLKETTVSADARARYDAAAVALTDQIDLDAKARELARSDRLIASDLVFENAVEGQKRLIAELDAGRAIDAEANQARVNRLTRMRFGMNAASLGFVTLLTVLFGRAVRRETPAPDAAAAPATASTGSGLMLRPDAAAASQTAKAPVTAKSGVTPAAAGGQADARTRQPVRGTAPSREALPLRPSPAPPLTPLLPPPAPANLTEVAELCVDLGRVIDSRDVPSLVERASAILQAKGVVLWVADSAGAMLRPSVTHGYSEKTVSRLGPLQIDGDNVTSLAFRSMRPQTMAGSGAGASSALAVPLLTASGCVGVLAAETTTDRPAGELLPVARIIAAQFAALIAPAEDEHGSFAATRSSL
jgi:hypothetical protein